MNQPNDVFADILAGAFIVAVAAVLLVIAWKFGGCIVRAEEQLTPFRAQPCLVLTSPECIHGGSQ